MRCRRLSRWILGALAWAPMAHAGTVAVLTQPEVGQYELVVSALRSELPSARVVDVRDSAAVKAALSPPPDVVVAVGTRSFEVAKAEAGGSAIVAAAVINPQTGGRQDITGVPIDAKAADAFGVLHGLAPDAHSVLVLHPPGDEAAVADARAAARERRITVDLQAIGELQGFQDRFRTLLAGHDAVWMMPDARLARPELVKFMVETCIERRVPLIGFVEGMTRAGALASVSADYANIGREAGRLANAVASRSRSARANVPFRFASGKVSVSQRTRELLGLSGEAPAGAEMLP